MAASPCFAQDCQWKPCYPDDKFLNRICRFLESRCVKPGSAVSVFHCIYTPKVALRNYLERICSHISITEEVCLLSLVYIDRLLRSPAHISFNSLTVHRILLTSMVLALTWLEDDVPDWESLAKVGGVPVEELVCMMSHFLRAVGWCLHVNPNVIENLRAATAQRLGQHVDDADL